MTPTSGSTTSSLQLLGSRPCASCHADKIETFAKTSHAVRTTDPVSHVTRERVECASCHGPGTDHAVDGAPEKIVTANKLTARKNADLCLKCHTDTIPEAQWLISRHGGHGLSCSSCHTMMKPTAGKLLSKPETQLCGTCHTAQATQFTAGTHGQKAGITRCSQCHNPHVDGDAGTDG